MTIKGESFKDSFNKFEFRDYKVVGQLPEIGIVFISVSYYPFGKNFIARRSAQLTYMCFN